MKHIIHATIIALAGMLAACTHTDEKPTLMVSILPQKYVLDKIADGKFSVECMLEKGETDMQLSTFIMISDAVGLKFALTY